MTDALSTIPTRAAVARPAPKGPLRRLLGKPLAIAALVVLVPIVLVCALAPLIAPYAYDQGDLAHSLQGPSAAHWLGTDQLGRDVLSRLLWGGRLSLFYAALVATASLVVGVPIGLLAGYRAGRPTDRLVILATDIGLAMPVLIVVIVILAVFRDYFVVALLALGLLLSPPLIRIVRAAALAVRTELFVDAAYVAGLSSLRIIARHILPRVSGPILVQASLAMALSLQFTVGLSFLGFGAQPPTPTWGTLIAEGNRLMARSPWLLTLSGTVLALVTLAFGLLGDAIRDIFVEQWSGSATKAAARKPRRSQGPVVTASAPALEPGSATILTVSGLAVAYGHGEDEVLVASGVDFTIAPGEAVGIVGESGCGKTSVARSIVRLLSTGGSIVGGEIRFGDERILELTGSALTHYRGGSVSYIAQEPMTALDPTMRVGTQLIKVLEAHGIATGAAARAEVLDLLTRVRLTDPAKVARSYPHELSGGMAQRVAIARAIAARPKLLIADEPTTALDVTVQAEIVKLLKSLQEDEGMAILLVSHDWGVVSELCDRALVMYAGEIVEQGPVQDIIAGPAHPYTQGLLASRPRDDSDRSLPLPTMAGGVLAPGDWPNSCRFASRCPLRVDACVQGPVSLRLVAPGRDARCIRAEEVLDGEPATVDRRLTRV